MKMFLSIAVIWLCLVSISSCKKWNNSRALNLYWSNSFTDYRNWFTTYFDLTIQYAPIDIDSCFSLENIELKLIQAKEKLELIIQFIEDKLKTLLVLSKYNFINYFSRTNIYK